MPEWIEEHVSQSTSLGGKQACEQFMYRGLSMLVNRTNCLLTLRYHLSVG